MIESQGPSRASVKLELPPFLAADLSETPCVRDRWYWTIAPAYAGVFVWVPFFDQLSRETLPAAPWPVLIGAGLAAAILCDLLLFRVPALWGFRSGESLSVVASAPFGIQGSKWITGPVLGIAAIVWQAVALTYALELIFRALINSRFLEPTVLEPWKVGALTLRPPIVLLALVWFTYITRLAGKSFAHVISTLMKVYTPAALVLLGLTAIGAISGVSPYRTGGSGRLSTIPAGFETGSIVPALQLIHLIFGFFAMAGLTAAEWGRTVADERDVRTGGIVGVGLACFLTTSLALLTVASSVGNTVPGAMKHSLNWADLDAPPFTFLRAVDRTIGGPIAGLILALLGIATLAPACYSASVYTHRFSRQWPAISRKNWSKIAANVAVVLVATYAVEQTGAIFTVMGAVFAPAVGCLAADFHRKRGVWTGIRQGYNPAGIGAWLIGLIIGLAPELGHWPSFSMASKLQPASLLAFVTAYLAYQLLATLGLESKTQPLPRREP